MESKMEIQSRTVTYLPLIRRAGLVRAFAALVRALPVETLPLSRQDVPEHLRRDIGLPPQVPGRGTAPPPDLRRTTLL